MTKGYDNLKPIKTLTKEQAKERGRSGGIKSAQSRRAKKNLAERIKLALTISTNENLKTLKREIRQLWKVRHKSDVKEELKTLLAQSRVIKDCGYDVYNIIKIAEGSLNPEVALRATNALWDREEGKPQQKLDVKDTSDNRFSSVKIVDGEKVIELK